MPALCPSFKWIWWWIYHYWMCSILKYKRCSIHFMVISANKVLFGFSMEKSDIINVSVCFLHELHTGNCNRPEATFLHSQGFSPWKISFYLFFNEPLMIFCVWGLFLLPPEGFFNSITKSSWEFRNTKNVNIEKQWFDFFFLILYKQSRVREISKHSSYRYEEKLTSPFSTPIAAIIEKNIPYTSK